MNPLDFFVSWSIHGHVKSERAMPKKASRIVICALIKRVRSCVEEANVIASAADQLAEQGQADKAMRLLMEIEGPTHETLDLFRTALKVRQTLLPAPQ